MVSTGAHDTNANSVAFVPASITINDIDAIPCVQVVDSTLTVDLPYLYRKND